MSKNNDLWLERAAHIENLEKQLAEAEDDAHEIEQVATSYKNENGKLRKQIVMLRNALSEYATDETKYGWTAIGALAATADLSGLILCNAEPVGYVQNTEFEVLPATGFSWVETRLHNIPLHQAKDQK
jgi:hypothetical protein